MAPIILTPFLTIESTGILFNIQCYMGIGDPTSWPRCFMLGG